MPVFTSGAILATALCFSSSMVSIFCLRARKVLSDKRWSLSCSSSCLVICSRATQVESSSFSGQLMLFMPLVWHLQKWSLSRLCPYYASTIWTFYNKHFLNQSLRHHCLGLIRMDSNISRCLMKTFYLRGGRSAVVSSKERKGQVFLLQRQRRFLFDKLSLLLLYTSVYLPLHVLTGRLEEQKTPQYKSFFLLFLLQGLAY